MTHLSHKKNNCSANTQRSTFSFSWKNIFNKSFVDSWVIIAGVIVCIVLKEYLSAAFILVLHQIFMFISYKMTSDKAELPGTRFSKYEKYARYVSYGLMCFALIVAVLFPLKTGNVESCIKSAVIILLVSCQNRIFDSLSLSLYNASKEFDENEIKYAGFETIEKLGHTKSLIFNKTGTITDSAYTVLGVYPKSLTEKQFISILTKVECKSDHPCALAVGADLFNYDNLSVTEIQGKGIEGRFDDNLIVIGNAKFLDEHGIFCDVPQIYGIAVHMAINGNYCGYIVFENKTRVGTFDYIEMIRDSGIESLYLLSSDLLSITQPVSNALGFDVCKAELNTEAKINATDYIVANKPENTYVAYAGNLNQELESSRHADISISLGCDTNADICTSSEGISSIPVMLSAAKKSVRIQKINIYAALISKGIVICMLILGIKSIIAAALILLLPAIFTFIDNHERIRL